MYLRGTPLLEPLSLPPNASAGHWDQEAVQNSNSGTRMNIHALKFWVSLSLTEEEIIVELIGAPFF